jgi:hypothetical protein
MTRRTMDEMVAAGDNMNLTGFDSGRFLYSRPHPVAHRTARMRFRGKAKNVQKFCMAYLLQ